MNSAWKVLFSKPKARVVHRKSIKDGWRCSACWRQFQRACNAGLHLTQSKDCRESFGMIHPNRVLAEIVESEKKLEVEKEEKVNVFPMDKENLKAVEVEAERRAGESMEEGIVDLYDHKVTRASRKGTRN